MEASTVSSRQFLIQNLLAAQSLEQIRLEASKHARQSNLLVISKQFFGVSTCGSNRPEITTLPAVMIGNGNAFSVVRGGTKARVQFQAKQGQCQHWMNENGEELHFVFVDWIQNLIAGSGAANWLVSWYPMAVNLSLPRMTVFVYTFSSLKKSFYNWIVPRGFLPWEIRVAFPRWKPVCWVF